MSRWIKTQNNERINFDLLNAIKIRKLQNELYSDKAGEDGEFEKIREEKWQVVGYCHGTGMHEIFRGDREECEFIIEGLFARLVYGSLTMTSYQDLGRGVRIFLVRDE